jgi:hypothetical protein
MRKNIKLPPCPICRTRKFRKNATGNYVCKYGHQLAVGDIADCIVGLDKLLNITNRIIKKRKQKREHQQAICEKSGKRKQKL